MAAGAASFLVQPAASSRTPRARTADFLITGTPGFGKHINGTRRSGLPQGAAAKVPAGEVACGGEVCYCLASIEVLSLDAPSVPAASIRISRHSTACRRLIHEVKKQRVSPVVSRQSPLQRHGS